MATTKLNSAKLKKVLAALEGNWQAEMEGHHTYLALAERDTGPGARPGSAPSGQR